MLVSYKKKFFEKFMSVLVLICLILANFVGCGAEGKEWVKKYKNDSITFSQLLLITTLKVKTVEAKVKKSTEVFDNLTFEDMKESNIKGTPALEYLKKLVEEDLTNILVRNEAARRLKIKFKEQERKALDNNGYMQFKSFCDSYNAHKIGISLEDCIKLAYWQGIEYKIGEAIYGEGKFGEIKEEKIKGYLNDKDNVVKYKLLSFPKSLQQEKVEKEVKKGDKKEIQQTNELKIKKHFKVEKTKDLVDLMFKRIKKGEKSFEDVEKELSEIFKKNSVTLKDDLKFFDDLYDDDLKNVYDDGKLKTEKKIKKNLKEMKKDNLCRLIEDEKQFYILKTIPMDENVDDAKKEKVKKILQEKVKENYIKKIEKEIKKKIETNDSNLTQSMINKQVKKVYRNKKEKDDFGIPEI